VVLNIVKPIEQSAGGREGLRDTPQGFDLLLFYGLADLSLQQGFDRVSKEVDTEEGLGAAHAATRYLGRYGAARPAGMFGRSRGGPVG
jgi:hypothetical protein